MGKAKSYTDRVDEYQIRDVTYFGKPPKDAPIEFDIVKWIKTEPQEVIYVDFDENICEKRMSTEHCYSVGRLVWNAHEPCFEFESVGLRWLEEKPGDAVIDMILKFCAEKEREILDDEGW